MIQKRIAGPAQIFTVANEKGGVGKTTIAIHLASYLVSQGYKVLGIDLDGQGDFSGGFLPLDDRINGLRATHLYAVDMPDVLPITTKSGVDLIYSLDGDLEVQSIEQQDLSVIPAFVKNLSALCDEYDFVVIDSPPTSGIKLTGAIYVADYIYVPVELAAFAVKGVRSLLGSFTRISRATGKPIAPTGFIINKLNSRSTAHRDSYASLRAEVGPLILRNSLKIRSSIDTAHTRSIPAWEMRASGAERDAANEMLMVMEEVAAQCGIPVEIRSAPVSSKSPSKPKGSKSKSAVTKRGTGKVGVAAQTKKGAA